MMLDVIDVTSFVSASHVGNESRERKQNSKNSLRGKQFSLKITFVLKLQENNGPE